MKYRSKIFKIKIILFVSLFLISGTYGTYKAKDLIIGPSITVNEPLNGSTLNESSVEIEGLVKNAEFVTINGSSILMTPEGSFKEKLLLSYGYNIITLEAKDRFNKSVTKTIELIYSKSNPAKITATLFDSENKDN